MTYADRVITRSHRLRRSRHRELLTGFFRSLIQAAGGQPDCRRLGAASPGRFCHAWGGVQIELIQPLDESSPVSKILKSKRGGLYHLCYVAEQELGQEIERFQRKGCLLISGPTPATAFSGRRVAFLYTPQYDIIELIESGVDEIE